MARLLHDGLRTVKVRLRIRRPGGGLIELTADATSVAVEHDGTTLGPVAYNIDAQALGEVTAKDEDSARTTALAMALAVLKGDAEAAAMLADLVLENYHAARESEAG